MAAADVPVQVIEPYGADKEMVAKIVQANSRRRNGPFVCVDSGALPAWPIWGCGVEDILR